MSGAPIIQLQLTLIYGNQTHGRLDYGAEIINRYGFNYDSMTQSLSTVVNSQLDPHTRNMTSLSKSSL